MPHFGEILILTSCWFHAKRMQALYEISISTYSSFAYHCSKAFFSKTVFFTPSELKILLLHKHHLRPKCQWTRQQNDSYLNSTWFKTVLGNSLHFASYFFPGYKGTDCAWPWGMHKRRGGGGGGQQAHGAFPFAFPSLPCMLFPCWAAGYGLFSSAVNTKTVCIQVTKSSVSFATEYNWALSHHKYRNGKKIRKN